MLPLQRAVFFDRDGVINKALVRDGKPYAPSSIAELSILEGVKPAISRLKRHGFLSIVITNQPEVRRGSIRRTEVEAMHNYLRAELVIDDVFACYHDDRDQCHCRKPLPGLILEAADKHRIDVLNSYFVGDRWRDIEAGHAAGCTTVFIDYRYSDRASRVPPDFYALSITEAVDSILNCEASRNFLRSEAEENRL